eukprot:2107814-Prymnesium_polylepis.2
MCVRCATPTPPLSSPDPQERFRNITQAYYRGAMGILLIYDVSNLKSWSNVRNWVRNIHENTPQT